MSSFVVHDRAMLGQLLVQVWVVALLGFKVQGFGHLYACRLTVSSFTGRQNHRLRMLLLLLLLCILVDFYHRCTQHPQEAQRAEMLIPIIGEHFHFDIFGIHIPICCQWKALQRTLIGSMESAPFVPVLGWITGTEWRRYSSIE